MLDMAIDKWCEFVKFMLAESVYKRVLDKGNFREFLHKAGGIFDFLQENLYSYSVLQKKTQNKFTKKTSQN